MPSAGKIKVTFFWDEKGVILTTPYLGRQQLNLTTITEQ
jgi:hypothetical protein